jgi:hypothetical protein
LFAINTNPDAPQFTEDGQFTMPYLSLEYACKQCHNGTDATELDLATLAESARGIHTP